MRRKLNLAAFGLKGSMNDGLEMQARLKGNLDAANDFEWRAAAR